MECEAGDLALHVAGDGLAVLDILAVEVELHAALRQVIDRRVDTRVMFSAGLAAQRLDWLKGCKTVFAIPVSASSKNPFFDRKPKEDK